MNLVDTYRYPIKSCRGQRLETAAVEPWGLAADRRWMLVDERGEAVTARDHPHLVLVEPELLESTLRVTAPGREPLVVEFPHDDELVDVSVWKHPLQASTAAAPASDWFSEVVGEPVRLVYLDDPTRRRPNPEHSQPGDRVSFADGYPLLLTTTESLAALNDLIAQGPHAAEHPLPMMRFRPNVVTSGAPAWAEDDWRRVRIGEVLFRNAKGCARCVFTTIDPETGTKGREPLATLARHRRWDGGIWFGINLIPDTAGNIRVGDEVEILE
jgi:uncharacterized protein